MAVSRLTLAGRPLPRYAAAVLLITALGFALRLVHLGSDSYWLDEVLTVLNTRNGLAGAIYAQRDHPPLLHVVTVGVISAFGEGEFAVRLPSALAGSLSVPLMAALGAAVGRRRAGVWAALLLAVLPFHIRYAQEARYYAVLMMMSLAAMIALCRALASRRPAWWLAWALATAANLYTHYGALLVLASHAVVIAGWSAAQVVNRRSARSLGRALAGPAAAALVVAVLYAPWMEQARLALAANLGSNAGPGTTGIAPFAAWIGEAVLAFGFGQMAPAAVMLALAVAGTALWFRRREWLALSTTAAAIAVPLGLIALFQVARWAFPKYVIFMLPPCLLAAGTGLEALVSRFERLLRVRRPGLAPAAIGTAVGAAIVLASTPLVAAEHAYVEEDWRAVAGDVASMARPGDVVVAMGLDLADGFNQGGIVLPYYLDRLGAPQARLASHSITQEDAQSLAGRQAGVWAALKNRSMAVQFAEHDMQVVGQYAGALSLAHRSTQAPDALRQLIAVYEQVLPVTVAPAPRCLLRQELAMLRLTAGDAEGAERDILAAIDECPAGAPDGSDRAGLLYRIESARLADGAFDDPAGRRAAARRVLSLNARDAAALAELTIVDLTALFRDGRAAVDDSLAPGPVEVRRFTMPQDGDWGDALFAHPPASISCRVALPTEPAELRFRFALAPESWDWGGDGATFVVTASAGEEPPRELFRQHVGNAAEDRRWHSATVSLAPYAGQTITVTLETRTGPAGDAAGDWAGWDDPRVLYGD